MTLLNSPSIIFITFNSNIWHNVAPSKDIKNINNLESDLSRSLEIKFGGAVGLPISYFLSVVHGRTCRWPDTASLQHKSLPNVNDPELTFQGHSKSNVMVQLDSLYMTLLKSNSNDMPIYNCLAVLDTWKFPHVHFLALIRPKFQTLHTHTNSLGRCFSKWKLTTEYLVLNVM